VPPIGNIVHLCLCFQIKFQKILLQTDTQNYDLTRYDIHLTIALSIRNTNNNSPDEVVDMKAAHFAFSMITRASRLT